MHKAHPGPDPSSAAYYRPSKEEQRLDFVTKPTIDEPLRAAIDAGYR